MHQRIAEIVESCTNQFVAEVSRGAEIPAFGSWVHVPTPDGREVYAVVSHVEIGSIEPGRRAVAFGKTTDELRKEMPHVLELLRTTFRAQVLAFKDARGVLRQTLPPFPADIHGFVYPCTEDQVRVLGSPYDFLRMLARNADPAVPVDELLVVIFNQIRKAGGTREAVVEAGRVIGRLFNDDHERLQSILRRID